MPNNEKKPEDLIVEAPLVEGGEFEVLPGTVHIEKRLPYFIIILGAISTVIAFIALLGLTLNAQASAGLVIVALTGIGQIIIGGIQISVARSQA